MPSHDKRIIIERYTDEEGHHSYSFYSSSRDDCCGYTNIDYFLDDLCKEINKNWRKK